ncbi:DUF3909 family protein [Desulfotomaculum sp. 1211_IL3151]|uniref:DUF3909 family protein n=1 Tax=Desulfotomaculum sp. 1211_IL3151 TaxID=3084055 RepID=UPI002FD8DDC9
MHRFMETVNQYLKGVALQQLTAEQKVRLKNNYNCKLYLFEYSLNANGDLVVFTSKSNYTNLLYYMGFDSANNDSIKLKIELADDVMVIYNINHERVAGLAQKLDLVS